MQSNNNDAITFHPQLAKIVDEFLLTQANFHRDMKKFVDLYGDYPEAAPFKNLVVNPFADIKKSPLVEAYNYFTKQNIVMNSISNGEEFQRAIAKLKADLDILANKMNTNLNISEEEKIKLNQNINNAIKFLTNFSPTYPKPEEFEQVKNKFSADWETHSKIIFKNYNDLLEINSKDNTLHQISELSRIYNDPSYSQYFENMSKVVLNFETINQQFTDLKKNNLNVAETEKKEIMDIGTELIKPVQRLPREILLLRDMARFSNDPNIQRCIAMPERLTREMNAQKKLLDEEKKANQTVSKVLELIETSEPGSHKVATAVTVAMAQLATQYEHAPKLVEDYGMRLVNAMLNKLEKHYDEQILSTHHTKNKIKEFKDRKAAVLAIKRNLNSSASPLNFEQKLNYLNAQATREMSNKETIQKELKTIVNALKPIQNAPAELEARRKAEDAKKARAELEKQEAILKYQAEEKAKQHETKPEAVQTEMPKQEIKAEAKIAPPKAEVKVEVTPESPKQEANIEVKSEPLKREDKVEATRESPKQEAKAETKSETPKQSPPLQESEPRVEPLQAKTTTDNKITANKAPQKTHQLLIAKFKEGLKKLPPKVAKTLQTIKSNIKTEKFKENLNAFKNNVKMNLQRVGKPRVPFFKVKLPKDEKKSPEVKHHKKSGNRP